MTTLAEMETGLIANLFDSNSASQIAWRYEQNCNQNSVLKKENNVINNVIQFFMVQKIRCNKKKDSTEELYTVPIPEDERRIATSDCIGMNKAYQELNAKYGKQPDIHCFVDDRPDLLKIGGAAIVLGGITYGIIKLTKNK
jgi:hypothetical protein